MSHGLSTRKKRSAFWIGLLACWIFGDVFSLPTAVQAQGCDSYYEGTTSGSDDSGCTYITTEYSLICPGQGCTVTITETYCGSTGSFVTDTECSPLLD